MTFRTYSEWGSFSRFSSLCFVSFKKLMIPASFVWIWQNMVSSDCWEPFSIWILTLKKSEHCIRTLGIPFPACCVQGHIACVTTGLSHFGSDLKAKGCLASALACGCALSVAPEPKILGNSSLRCFIRLLFAQVPNLCTWNIFDFDLGGTLHLGPIDHCVGRWAPGLLLLLSCLRHSFSVWPENRA